MHTSSKFAKVPPFSIGQDKITMRHGRTVSGLTFLTKLLFEEKSIKHCYHLKLFAKHRPLKFRDCTCEPSQTGLYTAHIFIETKEQLSYL
jgi:hypothetical protein